MRTRGFMRMALMIAAGGPTGISCGGSSAPGPETPNSFSVYGVYTGESGTTLENVMVDAGELVCTQKDAEGWCVIYEWEIHAQTWTDAAGRYSLQWSGYCRNGVPTSYVTCRALSLPQHEHCDNIQLQCTDRPQERNCTIHSR